MTLPLDFVRQLARDAGAAAMAFYGTAQAQTKAGGSPVTEADHAANGVIVDALREQFPGDAILSEESIDSSERLDARRVWIVDPLDGTKEFLAQNGEFAIMIGLVEAGEPVLGVVYMPDGDRMYSAAKRQGAWLNDRGERHTLRLQPIRTGAGAPPLRMVGSRSHGEPLIERMREALGVADVMPSGSVGVKCALVADGRRDVYIHPVPYLKEWDTCAPEVVLREAGGVVSDCHGEPLRYNKPDPRQPHGIVACAPGVHEHVIRTIAPLYEDAAA